MSHGIRHLNNRELAVLALVADGLANKEIGAVPSSPQKPPSRPASSTSSANSAPTAAPPPSPQLAHTGSLASLRRTATRPWRNPEAAILHLSPPCRRNRPFASGASHNSGPAPNAPEAGYPPPHDTPTKSPIHRLMKEGILHPNRVPNWRATPSLLVAP